VSQNNAAPKYYTVCFCTQIMHYIFVCVCGGGCVRVHALSTSSLTIFLFSVMQFLEFVIWYSEQNTLLLPPAQQHRYTCSLMEPHE